MKKVLLVSPPLQVNAQAPSKDNSYGLGLAYLHAVLEKEGYEVRTRSYNNSDPAASAAAVEAELAGFRPDFFLVQVFTMNRVESFKTIKKARELLPGTRIIAGGVHASIYPAQLLENYPVDCVVIGEGEVTIVELLRALTSGADLGEVKGIAYRKGGAAALTAQRPLIEDLDAIPFPRHGLFIENEPLREMGCILTSRGCPFRCSFCCLHTVSRRRFRTRSVKNVVDEIEYIAANFPQIKVLQIADDTFTLNQARAIEICREIIRRGVKMRFLCSARIKPASVELFEAMERAGFDGIGFGLETGSEKLLKSIHKNITRADVVETFKMLKDRKISIATYLMVGFPGETDETVAETIDLVKKLQKIKYFNFAGVAMLWVYPNTEVYEVLRAAGRMDDSYWLTDKDVPFFTLEHSEEELQRMITTITLACRPWRQWVRYMAGELLHPVRTARSVLPRLRKLRRAIFNK